MFFPPPSLFASIFRSPLFGHDAIAKQRVGPVVLLNESNPFVPQQRRRFLSAWCQTTPSPRIYSACSECAHCVPAPGGASLGMEVVFGTRCCALKVALLWKLSLWRGAAVPPRTRCRPALGSLAEGKPLLVAQPCVTEELSAPLNPAICASSLHLSITAWLPNPLSALLAAPLPISHFSFISL